MRTQDVGTGIQSPYNILGNLTGTSIYGTAGTSNTSVLSVQGIASGTAMPVSGPLTDAQLRATAVPVSGTVTATGPLTDTQLRATAVPVSLTSTTITGTVATTQSGTWTNTVTQATAASLNATVVGTGTFVVQNTNAAETTKVLGTVRNLGNVGGIFDAVAGAAVPANSLQIGMAQAGNLVTLTGTSGNLNVQCANCSGSGVSTVDAATFTASTSLFAGTGGFFQTTATNNALANGQQGMLQMTATRAAFANLRNAAGTEVAVAGAELFVGGRGTAGTATGGVLTVQGVASMTKLLVTPDSVALPANQSVNVSQVNAITPLMGNGATGTGSMRVTIANDNTFPTGWGVSSLASGSVVSGAYASGSIASGAYAAGSIGSGAMVDTGAIADAASTAGGTGSVNAKLRLMTTQLDSINTNIQAGSGATAATVPASGIYMGGRAASAAPTEVTNGQLVGIQTTLGGKIVNLPYSIKETVVSGNTGAMTATTSTSVIASAGGSLRNYITACTFSNSHATVGTMILLQDGSGGATLWQAPAAAVFGGAHVVFPTPIKTTAATALFAANVTTGANSFVSCTGYTGL